MSQGIVVTVGRPGKAEARAPFYLNCTLCQHEWICLYTPMEMGLAAKVMKASRCPMCGSLSKHHKTGRIPRPTVLGDWQGWLTSGDTGTSSETIWHVMTLQAVTRVGLPCDPSDFGRCHRLLEVMPEWRARLPEVASVIPAWTPLVDAWDELTALYLEELPSGSCPKLWARMRTLTAEQDRELTGPAAEAAVTRAFEQMAGGPR